MSNTDKSIFYTFNCGIPDSGPVHVEMSGEEYCLPAYHIKRSKSPIGVLCYVIGGNGTIRNFQNEYTASDGDVFILEKGSQHEYYVDSQNPWHILWFNVDGELLSILINEYGLKNKVVFHHAGNHMEKIFKKGIQYCADYANTDEIQKKLTLIITEIIIELSLIFKKDLLNTGEEYQIIKRYLDNASNQSCMEPLSLELMSTDLGISKKQITRICKHEMQCTPYDYYLQKKILLAKQYLRNTSMSVREISLRLGFCDPYYFSNFFKKKTGTCPRDYKQTALVWQDRSND